MPLSTCARRGPGGTPLAAMSGTLDVFVLCGWRFQRLRTQDDLAIDVEQLPAESGDFCLQGRPLGQGRRCGMSGLERLPQLRHGLRQLPGPAQCRLFGILFQTVVRLLARHPPHDEHRQGETCHPQQAGLPISFSHRVMGAFTGMRLNV
ncbi:MAG: hypothetical protein KA164_06680 [Rhodoferax sp.]|nr:hypothetical protein [Rhodoferax sp.]